MRIAVLLSALLAGCAATPEQMAQESNYTVCRFTMGGPHARVAEYERQRRSLDCAPYYGAIAAKLQAESAATSNLQRAIAPPPRQRPPKPVECRTVYSGNVANTQCY